MQETATSAQTGSGSSSAISAELFLGVVASSAFVLLALLLVICVLVKRIKDAKAALKAANGFTNLVPSIIVVVGYAAAFYFLSLTLRTLPVGIAYAIWSGLGIVLISIAGWVVYKQALDLPAIIGMSLIIAGVIVINAFSRAGH